AAEATLRTDLAGHAGHFGGERAELVHHRVDRVFQLEDLALDINGDLLRQVAGSDGGRHGSDVAHLAGQVTRHEVDAVGQVLPDAADVLDDGLAAEDALGADLARYAGHLRGEGAELVHHDVDGVLQLQDLALDVHGDLLGEVA